MKIRLIAIAGLPVILFSAYAHAQSTVASWGANNEGQINVPASLGEVMAIDGSNHTVALRTDGSVACWGRNAEGQCNHPTQLPPIVSISAGTFHTLALSNSGTVFAWGRDSAGVCSGPASTPGVSSIAAAGYGSVVALQDGTVRGWGTGPGWGNGLYQPPSGLTGVVQVVGADVHAGARKSDGSVVCWGVSGGIFDLGQSNVPSGLSGVAKLAMGAYHSIAVKADGSLVTWGSNSHGQRNVPAGERFVDADGGNYFSVGMTIDGRLLCWGDGGSGQLNIPAAARSGVLQVAAGGDHVMAIFGPAITITSARPVSAPSAGGTVVTITGTNFRPTSHVWFGNVEATAVEVLSTTSIRATAPAHAPGEVDLRVDYGSSTGFYYRPECGSDLDQNGSVDAGDISIILLDFGPCYEPPAALAAPASTPLLADEPAQEPTQR
jgi:hypothetical protein